MANEERKVVIHSKDGEREATLKDGGEGYEQGEENSTPNHDQVTIVYKDRE